MESIHSEFSVRISLPPEHEDSIFNILDKVEHDLSKNCPHVFEVQTIDSLESSDFSSGFMPHTVILSGYLDTSDPVLYATTKQMLHMTLRKYSKKYNLNYTVSTSKISVNLKAQKKTETALNY
ncbi:hypothetical protein KC678_02700 [Candidatus Dojkabacteria bacterium]|uniref:Uncharacterized protein n=1 Tax=Candidatus Dojkabacteria bacterium TaxID=2099670 RepID=A0A955IAQ6_9BACT|nr:hypothetical protein [Candidatus Dojkabacteria bacterium]